MHRFHVTLKQRRLEHQFLASISLGFDLRLGLPADSTSAFRFKHPLSDIRWLRFWILHCHLRTAAADFRMLAPPTLAPACLSSMSSLASNDLLCVMRMLGFEGRRTRTTGEWWQSAKGT